jgi:hypothetical protein
VHSADRRSSTTFKKQRLRQESGMKKAIVSLVRPELVTEAAAQWGSTEEAVLLDDVTNLVYEIKSP